MSDEEADQTPPEGAKRNLPTSRVKEIFEQLEFSVQKGRGGFDVGDFTAEDRTKALDLLAQNEANSFAYHKQRLEVIQRVELAKISASTSNHRTLRYALLGVLVAATAITFVILLLKDQYFSEWLAFIIGIAGGFGMSKVFTAVNQNVQTSDISDQLE